MYFAKKNMQWYQRERKYAMSEISIRTISKFVLKDGVPILVMVLLNLTINISANKCKQIN